jgi:opacity protein-like surface antigen
MKKQITVAVLLLALGLGTAAMAQDAPTTENPKKFWIMPTIGYRSSGTFEVESTESPYTGFRIDSAFTYGLSFGYRLSPILAVEAMWSRANPSVYGTAPAVGETPAVKDFLFNAAQDHLQANLMLSTGYTLGAVKPFFMAGLGMTSIQPEGDIPGFTRFSWSFGLGFDAMFTKSLGVRAQGKFSPTYINTIDAVLVEWPGGSQTTSLRNTMTQWEFQTGVFFTF